MFLHGKLDGIVGSFIIETSHAYVAVEMGPCLGLLGRNLKTSQNWADLSLALNLSTPQIFVTKSVTRFLFDLIFCTKPWPAAIYKQTSSVQQSQAGIYCRTICIWPAIWYLSPHPWVHLLNCSFLCKFSSSNTAKIGKFKQMPIIPFHP